jgi:hypothetical protein
MEKRIILFLLDSKEPARGNFAISVSSEFEGIPCCPRLLQKHIAFLQKSGVCSFIRLVLATMKGMNSDLECGSPEENGASIVGISGPGGWSAFSGELDWQS